jgi:biofilm PGA synthesis N-glycosyltransferase PgaC
VRHTLDSMVAQSILPVRWILVNDGCTDGTSEVLTEYERRYPFIKVVLRAGRDKRQPGGRVVQVFNRGMEEAEREDIEYDVLVKLDCDLSFEPDYFSGLLHEFAQDSRLGIASGVYLERPDDSQAWRQVEMPSYHAAGACKAVKRACWSAIGGFVVSRGWDTVDEIRAMRLGWGTRHFEHLQMKHWKSEGSGIGDVATSIMHGEVFYLTGGSATLLALKAGRRLFRRPAIRGALGLLWGYWWAALTRRPKVVSTDDARFYRSLLWRRLGHGLRGR